MNPHVVYHNKHTSGEIICLIFNNSMICFLCVAVVKAPCFLSSYKKEQNTAWHMHDFGTYNSFVCAETLR